MELIKADGQPRYGFLCEPVEVVNYLDFDLRTPMDRRLPDFIKRFRFNHFQFMGILADDLIMGVAIVDLKLVSNCFVYHYDCKTGKLEEHSFLSPMAMGTRVDLTPDSGRSSFRMYGSSVSVSADAGQRRRHLEVSLKSGLHLRAVLQEPEGYDPLRVCSRAGYDGWVYTQKAAGLPVSGQVSLGSEQLDLESIGASASYDWSCGFMRRHTFWNWASFSGTSQDGLPVGLNLAAGVNETGVTENAFWVDNRICRVGPVVFEFDRYQPDKPWRVFDPDGRVQLDFFPEGRRRERINALVIASNFNQMFGYFTGELRRPDGAVAVVERIPGFVEDHYAKW